MRRLALFAVLALAACATEAPAPSGYRDGTPLSVTTRSDPARLAGRWYLRGAYPGDAALREVVYRRDGTGEGEAFELVSYICATACGTSGETWPATPLGPNRWQIENPKGDATRQLWVVWVDEGYRTAAIGAPDGAYGWVLDRAKTGGSDRIRAAREILEFNGYDIGAMVMRP